MKMVAAGSWLSGCRAGRVRQRLPLFAGRFLGVTEAVLPFAVAGPFVLASVIGWTPA